MEHTKHNDVRRQELLNNMWSYMKKEPALRITELRNLFTITYRVKCKYEKQGIYLKNITFRFFSHFICLHNFINDLEILKKFLFYKNAFLFPTQLLPVRCFFPVSSKFSRKHSVTFLHLFQSCNLGFFNQKLKYVKKARNDTKVHWIK